MKLYLILLNKLYIKIHMFINVYKNSFLQNKIINIIFIKINNNNTKKLTFYS